MKSLIKTSFVFLLVFSFCSNVYAQGKPKVKHPKNLQSPRIPAVLCGDPTTDNLVINGGFEQFVELPGINSLINLACNWTRPNFATPDYFHRFATHPSRDVPDNFAGTQEVNPVPGGDGYAGIYFGDPEVYREIIMTQLDAPLEPNTTYELSFDVSLSEDLNDTPIQFQAYLGSDLFMPGGGTELPIGNDPGGILLSDTAFAINTFGWDTVTFTFTTGNSAGQEFLYLGGIFNTVVAQLDKPVKDPGTYYYIDNVRLLEVSLWPRTFGGPIFNKRSASDLTVDEDGNVYVTGRLRQDDISFEDLNFSYDSNTLDNTFFIMKFNTDGVMIWVEYVDDLLSGLEYHNGNLYTTTLTGNLLKYDLDGIEVDSYYYGNRTAKLALNHSNGDLYLATTFIFTFPFNGDYGVTVETDCDRFVSQVIKLNSNLEYIDSVSFNAIECTYATIGEFNAFQISDIEYAEDQNSVYVVGSMSGAVSIENNPPHPASLNEYMTIEIDDNGGALNVTNNLLYDTELMSHLEIDEVNDRIFINKGNEILYYNYNLESPLFYGEFSNSLPIQNMKYNQIEDVFIAISKSDLGLNSSVAKFGNLSDSNGIYWEKLNQNKKLANTSLMVNGVLYITGEYNDNTTFDDISRQSYGFENDIFIARIIDDGTDVEYKMVDFHSEKGHSIKNINPFNLFPNPVLGNFTISSNSKGHLIEKVIVRNLSGLQLKSFSGYLKNSILIENLGLSSGLYLIEIIYNDFQKETLTIVVK